ncbi:MAG: hypothetical protein C4B55_05710 [Candidatus Methanophagaceae archaeon]|nr:MAG: hypothetical protein C4B55_05710 [Methanophagales archaeon]
MVKNAVVKPVFPEVCLLGAVFFMTALMVALLLPVFAPPADASFSSVTITDVEPTDLRPGETKEVTMTVKNNGGMDARDIRMAFQGTEVVSVVGATVIHINSLNSWSRKEVKVYVQVKEEAPNGVYSVPVSCSWRGYYFDPSKGYVATDTIKAELGISFNVEGEGMINIGAVTTDPADVRPGDEDVEIRAFVENSGEAAAKDVEVKLISNFNFNPSWSGTDRSYIGRLNSGDSKEAAFYVDVADNTEAKKYSLPLKIKYKDTRGKEYEVTRSVDLLVEPKPDFEIVSYRTEPASINAGEKAVKLRVTVKNVGSEEAESVSVRITDEAEVPFDYDVKSGFVGNLKVGETGEAVLEFEVDGKAEPKEYSQGVEIRCTGDRDLGDENVYIFDDQIRLEVTPSGPGGSSKTLSVPVPGFSPLFALLALSLAFVFVRRMKKV